MFQKHLTKNIKKFLQSYFPLSLRDGLIFLITMLLTSLLCLLLRQVSSSDVHVPMIFVLAVLIIALLTNGYLYGFLAAVLSVLGVNWAFTYPYFELNFSITGYPLTFLTMLTVGFAVSTLTSRVKEQERIRIESEKEKTRANLLRAISHDLRTPLTSISGAISAVLEGGEQIEEEQRTELLSDARKDADWLCRMVENLLSITRISDETVSQIRKEDELLEEVLGEVTASYKKKNPQIELHVMVPEEPTFVPMDAMLVEQVLLNLMDNAVIHGQTTSCVTVTAWADRELAHIRVSDNGKGFERENPAALFRGLSHTNDGETADKTRNMGIGLAVCRTIVEAHGGTIRAENLPEGGACVTFSLGRRSGL